MIGLLFTEVKQADLAVLEKIGRLRYKVWHEEGSLNPLLMSNGLFLDELDESCRHWLVEDVETGTLVASARLTIHNSFEDEYRDIALWVRAGKCLPLPTCDLGRLVVLAGFRGRGISVISVSMILCDILSVHVLSIAICLDSYFIFILILITIIIITIIILLLLLFLFYY
jgi:hypothetical protein